MGCQTNDGCLIADIPAAHNIRAIARPRDFVREMLVALLRRGTLRAFLCQWRESIYGNHSSRYQLCGKRDRPPLSQEGSRTNMPDQPQLA